MKLKFVLAMLATGGLFVAPAFADQAGQAKEKAAAEAPVGETVTAFVVAATGGG